MENDYKEQYAALSRLEKKVDELYHRIAVGIGLSESAFWTLFCLCEDPDEIHTQNSLSETVCLPKQTLNSTVNNLVKSGYMYLEQMSVARNSKSVHLTAKGQEFCNRFIIPVLNAGENALMAMTEEEIDTFISLSQKQFKSLQEQLYAFLEEVRSEKQ